jgi:septum formation protein
LIRLCSSSPTRADILSSYGVDFIKSPSEFDEDSIQTSSPREFVYRAIEGKYADSIKRYGLDLPLLVADSVVSCSGEILRKAKNIDDAKKILLKQSGKEISIITGMIYKDSKRALEFIDISKTTYYFSNFDLDDIDNYLKSKEWVGKAGACMVEGFCKNYIKYVKGYESCAMGLSMERLLPYIK